MGLFSWITSIFKKRATQSVDLVPFYDFQLNRLVHIPAAELRPGCVQVRIEGIEGVHGTVWALPEQLQPGPIQHPPFPEDIRDYIREIQAAFAEHRSLSFDEWEEGFRRDMHPEREIAIWVHAANIYRLFTSEENDAARRYEIYRVLGACMTASPDSVWHIIKLHDLNRAEAERIVRRFYGGEKAVNCD